MIIFSEQGGDAWHKKRSRGLGGSDLPIVMGDSPYKTANELWAEKAGLVPRKEANNFAVQMGRELEPKCRQIVELLEDKSFPAANCQHPDYDFVRCSLDGINIESGTILEIKTANQRDHALAANGEIPKQYMAQLQWNLFCCETDGVDRLIYFSYHRLSKSQAALVVFPNEEYIKQMFEKASVFWEHVQSKTPLPADF